MLQSGTPFSTPPGPGEEPLTLLPDLLAGLMDRASGDWPVEERALTPEVLPPENPPSTALTSQMTSMPDFLAGLRSLLAAQSSAEATDAEFPPEASEDFANPTNELLTHLLHEWANPPEDMPPVEEPETLEDFQECTQQLLDRLILNAVIAEDPVPHSAGTEFTAAQQDLLAGMMESVTSPAAPNIVFQDVKRGLLGGLLASIDTATPVAELMPVQSVPGKPSGAFTSFKAGLLEGLLSKAPDPAPSAETLAPPPVPAPVTAEALEPPSASVPDAVEAVADPVVDSTPTPERQEPEPAAIEAILSDLLTAQVTPEVRNIDDLGDVARFVLDGLLSNLAEGRTADAQEPLHNLGAAPLEYIGETDEETVERPAGPFELLLDAIDSELGRPPTISTTNAPATGKSVDKRFIAFDLDGRSYAFPFDSVLETDRIPRWTHVPGLPQHLRGVLNLRGEILPLVDLRLLFGFSAGSADGRMLVIRDQGATSPLAFVVDRLVGLSALSPEELTQRIPAEGDAVAGVLQGFVSAGGRMVGLLDPGRVLAAAHGDQPVSHETTFTDH